MLFRYRSLPSRSWGPTRPSSPRTCKSETSCWASTPSSSGSRPSRSSATCSSSTGQIRRHPSLCSGVRQVIDIIRISFFLSVCLSVCLAVCLSLSVSLSLFLFLSLFLCVFLTLSHSFSLFLSLCVSFSVCLSVCLSLSLSLSLTLYYSSSPQQTHRYRFPETNFPSNKPCPFPETIPPPNIILFFLSTGCGKSVLLAHVAHFCHLQNHIILNFRKIQNWLLLHQEVSLI